MKNNDILTDFKYKTSIPTRFSDMDMFGHLNNAVYLTYFEQARSAYWRDILNWNWKENGIVIAKSTVEYLKPIFLQDEVLAFVKTSKIGKTSFEIEYILAVKKVSRKEFSYSAFSRAFTLPENADVNKIAASYEDGILNITIAKKEEEKVQSREIAIS